MDVCISNVRLEFSNAGWPMITASVGPQHVEVSVPASLVHASLNFPGFERFSLVFPRPTESAEDYVRRWKEGQLRLSVETVRSDLVRRYVGTLVRRNQDMRINQQVQDVAWHPKEIA